MIKNALLKHGTLGMRCEANVEFGDQSNGNGSHLHHCELFSDAGIGACDIRSVSDFVLDWSEREEGEALEATPIEKGANADLFLTMDGRENQRSGINSFARSKQLSTKELLGFHQCWQSRGEKR